MKPLRTLCSALLALATGSALAQPVPPRRRAPRRRAHVRRTPLRLARRGWTDVALAALASGNVLGVLDAVDDDAAPGVAPPAAPRSPSR